MKLAIRCFSIILLLCTSSAALAQSDSLTLFAGSSGPLFFDAKGDYLTAPVRKAVGERMATRLQERAQSSGFTQFQTQRLTDALRTDSLRHPLTTGSGERTTGASIFRQYDTPQGRVIISNSTQESTLQSVLNVSLYQSLFEAFATVRLKIRPVPPRDYKVVINGEMCTATEQASYKVPPGQTSVIVSRAKKPPCAWTGDISSGAEHLLECNL